MLQQTLAILLVASVRQANTDGMVVQAAKVEQKATQGVSQMTRASVESSQQNMLQAQGAVLDMLKNMSPLNKRIIDLETNQDKADTADKDNYSVATLTNRRVSSKSDSPLEENNHVQLSSKLHSKVSSGSKSQSKQKVGIKAHEKSNAKQGSMEAMSAAQEAEIDQAIKNQQAILQDSQQELERVQAAEATTDQLDNMEQMMAGAQQESMRGKNKMGSAASAMGISFGGGESLDDEEKQMMGDDSMDPGAGASASMGLSEFDTKKSAKKAPAAAPVKVAAAPLPKPAPAPAPVKEAAPSTDQDPYIGKAPEAVKPAKNETKEATLDNSKDDEEEYEKTSDSLEADKSPPVIVTKLVEKKKGKHHKSKKETAKKAVKAKAAPKKKDEEEDATAEKTVEEQPSEDTDAVPEEGKAAKKQEAVKPKSKKTKKEQPVKAPKASDDDDEDKNDASAEQDDSESKQPAAKKVKKQSSSPKEQDDASEDQVGDKDDDANDEDDKKPAEQTFASVKSKQTLSRKKKGKKSSQSSQDLIMMQPAAQPMAPMNMYNQQQQQAAPQGQQWQQYPMPNQMMQQPQQQFNGQPATGGPGALQQQFTVGQDAQMRNMYPQQAAMQQPGMNPQQQQQQVPSFNGQPAAPASAMPSQMQTAQSQKIAAKKAAAVDSPAEKYRRIFTSEMPAHEKIIQFTKQYCLPELIDNKELVHLSSAFNELEQKKTSRDLIPYICFYNGLAILQQLDRQRATGVAKIDPPKDLLSGFKKKREFILSLKNGHTKTIDQCAADLKAEFSPEQEVKPAQTQQSRFQDFGQLRQEKKQVIPVHVEAPLDNLMPLPSKYEHNNYLNIFSYFCKKQIKANQALQLPNSPPNQSRNNLFKPQQLANFIQTMYTTGLELQSKLDKIMDYDSCNDEQAAVIGLKPYCQQLFSREERLSAFHFWGEPELKEGCENAAQRGQALQQGQSVDRCQLLNEAMFTLYHQTQMGVLAQVVSVSREIVARKTNKEMQLRQLVEEANSGEAGLIGQQMPSQQEPVASAQQSSGKMNFLNDLLGDDMQTPQVQQTEQNNTQSSSVLSLMKQPSSQQQDPFVASQIELNKQVCQAFADQFADSPNVDTTTSCDYLQKQSGNSLSQQSIVALQDHSQRIYKSLQELNQSYVRCFSIKVCASRMQPVQKESYQKIQLMLQQFMKGGFVTDESSTQPQQAKTSSPTQTVNATSSPKASVVEVHKEVKTNNSTQNKTSLIVQSNQTLTVKPAAAAPANSTQGSTQQNAQKEADDLQKSIEKEVSQKLSPSIKEQISTLFKSYVEKKTKENEEALRKEQQAQEKQMNGFMEMQKMLEQVKSQWATQQKAIQQQQMQRMMFQKMLNQGFIQQAPAQPRQVPSVTKNSTNSLVQKSSNLAQELEDNLDMDEMVQHAVSNMPKESEKLLAEKMKKKSSSKHSSSHISRKKMAKMLRKQKRLLQQKLDEEFKHAVKGLTGGDKLPLDKSQVFIEMKPSNTTQLEITETSNIKKKKSQKKHAKKASQKSVQAPSSATLVSASSQNNNATESPVKAAKIQSQSQTTAAQPKSTVTKEVKKLPLVVESAHGKPVHQNETSSPKNSSALSATHQVVNSTATETKTKAQVELPPAQQSLSQLQQLQTQPNLMIQQQQPQQMPSMSDEQLFALQQQQLFQNSVPQFDPTATQSMEMPPEMQQALMLQQEMPNMMASGMEYAQAPPMQDMQQFQQQMPYY